ncbi:MAG: hypothetical protein JWR24_5520 [Actinoallomurus sp.]|nr:hypothetical protein [Actinoallomurus sp.]
MIYLDTWALVKLVREAPETRALLSYLRSHAGTARVSQNVPGRRSYAPTGVTAMMTKADSSILVRPRTR